MKYAKIAGATRAMGKDQPEYETLWIRDDLQPYDFGPQIGVREVNHMRFEVKPSREDIERLIAGESLFVTIMGSKFAPFHMQVGDPNPPGICEEIGKDIGEPQGEA